MNTMDTKTYAAVAEVCRRLAGRLSDDVLGTVREQYAAGELDLADGTLLLSLAYQGVGVTAEERDLMRAFVGDPDGPDLAEVPVVAQVPPLSYRFVPDGPADAPDPAPADALLSANAPRRHGLALHRAWRVPLDGAPDAAAWAYVLQVAEGTDELSTYSGVMSRLWVGLQQKWPVEVIAGGSPRTPYQEAALAGSQTVWRA
ncbi:hypothetical protein GA0070612_3696 [Micromonospora chokoriensis]|uniref:Uncharacterized protein n=2 Tax=Micromonospora chokoriensis TaxID=356851 RepID=A0A1C4XK78_9ACTN|nr:hypothetical protein GA0070612_3696 [Micromonospora chokoriensis]